MVPAATRILEADHRRIRAAGAAYLQTRSPSERSRLADAFLRQLEVHAWLEERLFYPRVAGMAEALARGLGDAHGAMRRAITEFRLARLAGGSGSPRGREILAELLACFLDHAAEEEAGAFPVVAADPGEDAALGAGLARLRDRLALFPPLVQTIDVGVPVRVAYNQWTRFEEFPRFLASVREVRQVADTRLRWEAQVACRTLRWTSEIYEQIPDRRIAWCSVDGAPNAGSVTFRPVPGDGTRLLLELIYEPQGLLEDLGALAGVLSRHLAASLASFKAHAERNRKAGGARRGRVAGNPWSPSSPEKGADPQKKHPREGAWGLASGTDSGNP